MKNTITSTGFNQEGLVDLFDKMTGRLWLPIDIWTDIGNAALTAVGTTTTVAVAFDKATDEHVGINLVLPKIADVSRAMALYVYYSSVNTTGSKAGVFGLSMKATAAGEDIGATHTLATVVADTDSTTADDLGITSALAIAAGFMASTEELLSLSLYRDANHASDNVDADIEIYGARLDFYRNPQIKTTD